MDTEFGFVDAMAATNTALSVLERGREPIVQVICQARGALVAGIFSTHEIDHNYNGDGGSCYTIALRKMGSRGDSWG